MPFPRAKQREPFPEQGLFDYAVAVLARRPRTERDLRRLLRLRAEEGEPGQQATDRVITRLLDLNYLSDSRFAADFTHLRKENEKHGRRRVQQDLLQRGVPKELAACALGTAYDDEDEVALARAYVARKRIQRPIDQKDTSRVMNRLLRAGFSSNSIFKLLRAWNIEVEEAEIEDRDSGPEV